MRIPAAARLLIPLAVVFHASPADVGADFSGSYALTNSKHPSKGKPGAVQTLRVIQTESSVEITKTIDGVQNANKFPLDGSDGPYVSPGGVKGAGRAQFKGKTLVLETLVFARPQLNAPEVQIHTKERWNLSSDSKKLTIRTDVDFPNSQLHDLGFQLIEPWTETYTRD
jgi:hypothetical protein